MTLADLLDPEESHWKLLALYLRKERSRRKLSQAEVAKIIEADKSRVSNYEAGRLKITKLHAEALDRAWDTMFAILRKYAVKFGQEDDWVKQLWDFEKGSLVVKTYYHGLIPVPLQVESYARELLARVRTVRDVDTALRERMKRTELLLEQFPTLSFWALIDETALDPPIDRELKQAQLQALLTFTEQVSVRIIPADQWHGGTDGSFELITTETGNEVAYMWAQLGGRLVHDSNEVRELSLRYDRMGAKALTEDCSRELIRQKLESL